MMDLQTTVNSVGLQLGERLEKAEAREIWQERDLERLCKLDWDTQAESCAQQGIMAGAACSLWPSTYVPGTVLTVSHLSDLRLRFIMWCLLTCLFFFIYKQVDIYWILLEQTWTALGCAQSRSQVL